MAYGGLAAASRYMSPYPDLASGKLADMFLLASGVGVASELFGSLQSAGLSRASGRYEMGVAERNARLADLQAQDALQRGEIDAQRYGEGIRQLQGEQLVSAAAQGLDPSAGTPAEIQGDTARIGALDMLAIRMNAAREAFGYGTEASDYRSRGRMAEKMGRLAGRSTLITGGLNAIRQGAVGSYGYRKLKAEGY